MVSPHNSFPERLFLFYCEENMRILFRVLFDSVFTGVLTVVGIFEEVKTRLHKRNSWLLKDPCVVHGCEKEATVVNAFCVPHWEGRIMWLDTLSFCCGQCGQKMFSYEVRLYAHSIGEEVRCAHCGNTLGYYGGGILLLPVPYKEE